MYRPVKTRPLQGGRRLMIVVGVVVVFLLAFFFIDASILVAHLGASSTWAFAKVKGGTSSQPGSQWEKPLPKDCPAPRKVIPDDGTCDPSNVNLENMPLTTKTTCETFERICVDQERFIVYHGPREAFDSIEIKGFKVRRAEYNTPGYTDAVVGSHRFMVQPFFRMNSTKDPSPLHEPHFDNCTVPLIFWPEWPFIPWDTYLNTASTIAELIRNKVINRNIRVIPVQEGLDVQPYFRQILTPYTKWPIVSMAEQSARANLPGCPWIPLCFEKVLFCNFWQVWDGFGPGMYPAQTGQEIATYFDPSRAEPAPDKEVVIMLVNRDARRRIINIQEILDKCNNWTSPRPGKPVRCFVWDFAEHTVEETIKKMSDVNVMVAVHGSGMANAYLLREFRSVVEILPNHFFPKEGGWPEVYGWNVHRFENRIFYFNLLNRNESAWRPGGAEAVQKGEPFTWWRDRETVLDWDRLVLPITAALSVEGNQDAYLELIGPHRNDTSRISFDQ